MGSSIQDKLENLFDDSKEALVGNQRKSKLMQFARKYGFDFSKRISMEDIDLAVRSFQFFKSKKRTRLKHVLSKSDEHTAAQITIFDSALRGAKKKTTTAIMMDSELLNLPRFIIRPRRTLEKVSRIFESNQHLLARYPDLQKKMTLQVTHPDYLQRYLTDQLAEVLLENTEVSIEGLDDWLLLYYEHTVVDLPDLLPFYQFATHFTEVLLFDHSNDLV